MSMKVKISKVKPNKDNPRLIKDDHYNKLVRSIEGFPEMLEKRPVVCFTDKDDKYVVLGGNMRLKASIQAGLKEIPIILADDWTEEQKKQFVIKDNVSSGLWDWDMLANEWDIDKLYDWGLDLPADLNVTELEAEEDNYQMPNEIKTNIIKGDIIEIGEHILMCGDSTDSDQVAKLMNGEKAEISFTSPPYNAGTTPTEIKMNKISKYLDNEDNKSKDEYLKLLSDFTNNSLLFSEYSFVNIQSLAGNKIALIDYLYNMKVFYSDTIIWQKLNSQPAMAENVLNSQYEYIHIFSKKANRHVGTKKFRGTLSNVLEISKQTKNKVKEHNATFSVDLANFFIFNFCEKSVIDLFLGSGTTMVAAHQLKRKCYGMELDEKYCQVIIDRMLKLDEDLEVKINGKSYVK